MVKDAPFFIWSDHLARTDDEEFLKKNLDSVETRVSPDQHFPEIVSQAVPHWGKVSEDKQR